LLYAINIAPLWLLDICTLPPPLKKGKDIYASFLQYLTRQGPLVEQKLLTLPEHLSSNPPFLWGSLVLCVCFVDHCLSFRPFSLGHCVVSPLISGFWLPLWYLQTFLTEVEI